MARLIDSRKRFLIDGQREERAEHPGYVVVFSVDDRRELIDEDARLVAGLLGWRVEPLPDGGARLRFRAADDSLVHGALQRSERDVLVLRNVIRVIEY